MTELQGHTLYFFTSCPYCQKVLSKLQELDIKVEQKNTRENDNFRTELLEGGGKTQVPCMRIETGADVEWMYESGDIIKYLEKKIS